MQCRKCNNKTKFTEYSLRETSQELTFSPSGRPEWSEYEVLSTKDFPIEIVCQPCLSEGKYEVVWKASQSKSVTPKPMQRSTKTATTRSKKTIDPTVLLGL